MRHLMRLFTILVVVIFMAPPVGASPQFPNAIGCKNGAYYGAWADIETANPQIRDGWFSMVWVFAQNYQSGNNWFAEAGWYKGFETAYIPQGVAIANGPSGYWRAFYEQMAVGSRHSYLVERYSGNSWSFYIDGRRRAIRDVGFASTNYRVCSGGETSSTNNAMGVSGCLENRRRDSDGVWRYYGSHYNSATPPYQVIDIDANNWQVLGNN